MAILQKPVKFIEEVKAELTKVSWPTFDSLKSNTWVVIALSLFLALYIFLVDKGLSYLVFLLY
ncbi:MAG: preprotein translocase subunit SecE [Calditrichaeota bacterium]|nr:MAG: preprotein translocase subunit SecE [Calditrichota bacterium]